MSERIVTRETTADTVRAGDVIVTENARGTQFRHVVTGTGPCLTDNHARHITVGKGPSCYSTVVPLQLEVKS